MTEFSSRRIAIIGSGIAGLGAAWLLARRHQVSLFEAGSHFGGHVNTREVEDASGMVPIDTGFIVFNERNYPNLVPLFARLGVPTAPSDMSFSASLRGGACEYSGGDLPGLLAQPSNLLRPRFWRMLRDLLRFYAATPRYLAEVAPTMTIGELLEAEDYSAAFMDDHLWPMAGAIWSASPARIRDYPAQAMLRFFANHGLVQLTDRPQWRTVRGGAKEYVRRLLADTAASLHSRCAIRAVTREAGRVKLRDDAGHEDWFDEVVIATHADDALRLLTDATAGERAVLGAFAYSHNIAWLHEDRALMPQRRRAWASWNYLERGTEDSDQTLCLTYWMNRLQPLPTARDFFVTLNPGIPPRDGLVHAREEYAHPIFDRAALAAQARLWDLQGVNRTWFCGAYFGHGFHEDGLQAGLAVAEQLGGAGRPWARPTQASRIPLPLDFPVFAANA